MKKLGLPLKALFIPEKKVSTLQMSMTFFLTLGLILANIMVVKSIDLFGMPQLANTCSIITFPITYILSDVFSEVYGYKWSRITASWAFVGTTICSLFFALMIAMPGNAAWDKQDQLINILGNTPQIAIASVIAFWFGDFANDKVFQIMKKHSKEDIQAQTSIILESFLGAGLLLDWHMEGDPDEKYDFCYVLELNLEGVACKNTRINLGKGEKNE